MKNKLYNYLLLLGDNAMIIGHRLSELCGHGPSLETDIALTNISLDMFGQVRNYFQYAAEIKGDETHMGESEDDIAFLRYEHEYKNALLVEQKNVDFAHVIARQYFFDAYHILLLKQLCNSKDGQIAAIANKSLKEVKYHHRFSSEWVKRLGDGTDISHQKMQAAVDYLYPYLNELTEETELEKEMKEAGIGADLNKINKQYFANIEALLKEATLEIPENIFSQSGGKKGVHSEHLGFILADLQYMQRAYPDMAW
ncbi:MAG TPA: phenylacetate-CoA oxygenase subunit PaaI [Bacteroidetes bacterium]|nr:phenylacetate-CoA oxygenase subunit PaaI [Bacteroidota bacterium]